MLDQTTPPQGQVYDEATRFLTLLDPNATGFTFQTFDDDKDRKDGSLVRVLHGTLAEHWDELVRLNEAGAGVYVTINETDFNGRTTENIVRIRAQFVDLDGAPLEPVVADEGKLPHLVVNSSPGKWHAYWMADGIALKDFSPIQQMLAEVFNGDASVHDLPRVMRLPGFFHRKDAPYLVVIQRIEDRAHYTVRDFPRPPEPEIEVKKGLDSSLNSVALQNLSLWVPELFEGYDVRPYRDGYRVKGRSLNRGLEEDIGIMPKGIKDFGVADQGDPKKGKRTPVSLVMEHKGLSAGAAVSWLCQRLGMDIAHAPAFSEEWLALEFAARHADDLRYVDQWGKWYRWDGKRWEEDKTRKVFDLSRHVCRDAATQANKGAKDLAKAKTRAAVVSLASDDRRLVATIEQWDADPWLLNTPGGIVDLKTGETRAARPEDYMTMMTTVTPGGACPQWHTFLDTVTRKDAPLKKFLQVSCGYALTGLTREQILMFLYGTGQNGKGVFIKTIAGVFGDYHTSAPMEMLVDTKQERHPTDLAALRGARLVTSAETEEGRRWAESKIKQLTGEDEVRARFMRQDFFTYLPQFLLIVYGNHKPGLKSVDKAIRRRLKLTPFTANISDKQRDNGLAEKLKDEWSGILSWMIEGCLIWQREGLVTPKAVEEATERYMAAEDATGRWIDECCEKDPQAHEAHAKLFGSWSIWAGRNNEFVGSSKRFSQTLEDRGFTPKKLDHRAGFTGLKVAVDLPPGPPPQGMGGEDGEDIPF